MPITKSFLRHELQNYLMLAGFQLDEVEFKSKKNITELLKIVSLFIENEEVFLGKKTQFYLQPVSLEDLFEILLASNEEIIAKRKISLKIIQTKEILKIDRDKIYKALSSIFAKLLETVSSVKISFDKTRNAIVLKYEGDLVVIKRKELETVLKQDKYTLNELKLQLALKFLDDFGCKLKFSDNEVQIIFCS